MKPILKKEFKHDNDPLRGMNNDEPTTRAMLAETALLLQRRAQRKEIIRTRRVRTELEGGKAKQT